MTIEKYPFNKSSTSVAIARDFFPVLKTFVVPIFPDPISLISFFKNIFVRTNPKGIEPNKYEYTATIIKFISINLSKLVHH